ncbi:MAG: trypsin-like peptidase domain-containing protein [Ideonella sp.]|nr:trypsin-like peptidase domain-containing protein [Ideonella sp.]MBL0150802.1 trypsin-like peptidase domain-containing protein [Ideonella sp.]
MLRRDFLWIASCALATSASAAGTLIELVEQASPSVVAVGTYDPLKSPRFNFRGTGFIVGSGTQVVTNAHVLPQANDPVADDRLAVLFQRAGATPDVRMARRQGFDPSHDLAVLQIDGPAITALPLATGPLVKAGQSVALIGYPLGTALGFKPVVHRGIVSAVTAIALPPPTARQLDERTLARLKEGAFDILQLDATAYPGNSGSPLLDADTGQVIGIINMVYVKSTKESAVGQPTGITYAIPVRYVVDLLGRP